MRRAIIVGAGVTGLSTAYHLARRNYGQITVLDKGPIGDGSSSRAAGICTGLLWSETGVRVRRRCSELYDELSRDLQGYEFRRRGCLNLFSSESWPSRLKLLPLYDRVGAPYEILDAAAIRTRWPDLAPTDDVVGLHDPLGGYSEPSEYLPALAARLRSMGVEILERQPVVDFLTQGNTVVGVRTAVAHIEADATVCTVYSWTRVLLERIGATVPVKAFVHQRYVSPPLPAPPAIPAVNANPLGIYFRPALGGRVLAGIETSEREEFRVPAIDFDISALTVPVGVREQLRQHLASVVPRCAGVGFEEERVGLLTFSLDGEPILGPVSRYPGLFLGLAFHSGGFAYNPGSGELLAQYVADGRPSLDLQSWHPDRFHLDESERYLATTITQKNVFSRRH